MKIWSCLLVAISSGVACAGNEEIVGTYKLVSSTQKILETGEVRDTYGASPKGFIMYGLDGRMLVLIVRGDRPKPASVESLTDSVRADLYRGMTAYGGTYTFDGKTVQHHIDISWNEYWTGTTQVRDIQKEGNRVILTTRPTPSNRDGKVSITSVVWEKIQ